MNAALALGISLVTAAGAARAGALTRGGAGAAVLVGTAVLFGAGWSGAAMLAAFFVSSIAVGRIALVCGRTADAAAERRNARQVLANGAAAAAGAVLARPSPGLGLAIVCGSLGAAAADTWATSIGAFSRTDPRHLLTGRRVPRGTSGGVSLLGTLAGLGGAATVALSGALAGGGARLALIGIPVGFGGMLLDSLLGASVQGRFECPECGIATERRRHQCATPARRVGGLPWLDNDGVNALSTIVAALAAGIWWANR
ncbi:MAG TPA: DUF92 domain-containing protein [Gemmatimonadales bacterium]|nr:DUF92 domain-containing protein [Gemmatimonadales bacterium]